MTARRVRSAVALVAALALCAGRVSAQPANTSSLPWRVRGSGPVVIAGGVLYAAGADARFGFQGLRVLPLPNATVGVSVFSTSEAVGEPVVGAPPGNVTTRIVSDEAGGWYVSGGYTQGLVRILPSGAIDASFAVTISHPFYLASVRAMAVQGSRLIVGGEFESVNGETRHNVAVLDARTGATLPVAPAVPGIVQVLAVAGTTVLTGGEMLNGFDLHTGAADPSWTATMASGQIEAIAVDNAAVYLGGSFTDLRGTDRAHLARLIRTTGAMDPGWDPGTDGVVHALVRAGGGLFVGGSFVTVGGQARRSLAEVDAATGAPTAWQADTDDDVFGLSATGATIYAGGVFTSIAGRPRRSVAAITAATPATVTPWAPDAGPTVLSIAATAAKVAVAGDIEGWGLRDEQGVLAIDLRTGARLPFAPRIREVEAMLVVGRRLILGGAFTTADGVSRTSLASYDLDTQALLPLSVAIDGPVLAMTAIGNALVIGGSFSSVNGSSRSNLAVVDVGTGQLLPALASVFGEVRTLALWQSHVLVGGAFTELAGSNGFAQRRNLAALTFAGDVAAFDGALSGDAFDRVAALEVVGNTVYVVGRFSTARGQPRGRGAAFDLATAALLPWDPGVSTAGEISNVSTAGGATYIAGDFFFFNAGSARPGIARLDAVTGALSPWLAAGPWIPVRAVAASAAGVAVSSQPQGLYFYPETALTGPPGPPVQPLTRVTGSTLTFAWQAPVLGPRPDGYLVDAGTAPGLANLGTFPVATSPLIVDDVPAGTYHLQVRARNTAATGAASPTVTVDVGASTCTVAPTATDVPSVMVTGDTVEVTWQPTSGATPTSYVVEAGTAEGRRDIGAFATGSLAQFAVNGVPAGVYFVRVVAENACGRSPASPDAVVRVGGVPGPPGTPLLLTATASGGGVRVTWLASASGGTASSHVLEAGSGPALSNIAALTLGAETSLAAAGVPPGTYYLRVRAVNAAGASAASGDVVLVVP